MLSIRVVLADLQGHHGWKALAILRMAGLQFSSALASSTPASALQIQASTSGGRLKTSNEQAAVDLGRRLLFQIEQRAEQGLPPKSKLFSAVIDDYIRYRERDHRHGKTSAGMLRQIIRVSKFWREYAGELAVEAIDDKVMREFIPWRRDYYANFKKLPKNAKLHPTDKTLQWDMMLGKGHCEMGSRAGAARKKACYNRNLHAEEEASATSVRAVGISSALADAM